MISPNRTPGSRFLSPIPIERLVERVVEIPVERIVERIIEIPVEKITEKVIEIPVEKLVERIVEVQIETIVEQIIEVAVERLIEKLPCDQIHVVYKPILPPPPLAQAAPVLSHVLFCPFYFYFHR